MASVILDFLPQKGYTELHIFEAPTQGAAPGGEIEVVVVDPDNPITSYTTDQALSPTGWFSIQWEDDKGGTTPMSDPIQGGTFSLVGKIKDRALLRDPSLDETVVVQEAEAIVSKYFGVEDPYLVDPADVTMDQITGLTYFTIARAHVATLIRSASSVQSYTAGLVSQKSGDSSAQGGLREMIDYLLAEANKLLGLNYTVVMLLEDIDPTGIGLVSTVGVDQSRLLLSLE